MHEISQVKISLKFAFTHREQHSETDNANEILTLSHNNKLHPCHWLHTCEYFLHLKTQCTETCRHRKQIIMFLLNVQMKERSVSPELSQAICNLVLHGFLAVMKTLICHPCVFFQHFKNTSLPTSVYLNNFCPITASRRCTEQQPEMAGTAAKKQDMQTMQVLHLQAFIQTSDVSGVPEWANAFFALKRWADAQRGCPFLPSPSQTYNILCPPSPPLHWFTSSFTASMTFYGDNIHTFSPFAQSHPAWSSQKRSR